MRDNDYNQQTNFIMRDGNYYSPYNNYTQQYQYMQQSYNENQRMQEIIKKEKQKKTKNVAKFIAASLSFGLISGTVFQGVNYGARLLFPDTVIEQEYNNEITTQQLSSGELVQSMYDVSDVADKVAPSIVALTCKATETIDYWFQSYEQEVEGSGSGIIIGQEDDTLYIVTNYHVIENSSDIQVTFFDESNINGTVKGYDKEADIAVVAINLNDLDKETKNNITIAVLGDSDLLQVGEPAIAMGNALGYGQSLTVGYVSALNREVQMTDSSMLLIQTDAAINPGNSGGALINSKGEVIGINTAKYSDTTVEGMGFAIPIVDVKPIVDDIIKNISNEDKNEKSYLGVSGKDITKEDAVSYNMPEGIYIVSVVKGSPAEKAGIKAGDIVVEFNGKEVYTMEELQNDLWKFAPDDKVSMVINRIDNLGNYTKQTVEVTLGRSDNFN